MYCVEWNTRNASPVRKSRDDKRPVEGRKELFSNINSFNILRDIHTNYEEDLKLLTCNGAQSKTSTFLQKI